LTSSLTIVTQLDENAHRSLKDDKSVFQGEKLSQKPDDDKKKMDIEIFEVLEQDFIKRIGLT